MEDDVVIVALGDYVKTPLGLILVEEVRLDFDVLAAFLANGEVIAVNALTIEDVLLESEVI
jgi:hypothetical protein